MKRILFVMLLMLAAPSVGSVFSALAQTPAPQMPPKVLRIIREEVKPYQETPHAKVESAWIKVFAKANWSVSQLSMTSMSGPPEAWFISSYDSFAAVEKEGQEFEKHPTLKNEVAQFANLDKDLLRGVSTIMAVFSKDLSYRSEQLMANLPKSRYFRIGSFHIRPGRDLEFSQTMALLIQGAEKARIGTGFAVYSIVSGAPGNTVFVFEAYQSLAEIDSLVTYDDAINAALGPENAKKLAGLWASSLESYEYNLFAFSPEMSNVSKEFAAADPDYWTPKPKPAAKPAAKKPTKKPDGGQ